MLLPSRLPRVYVVISLGGHNQIPQTGRPEITGMYSLSVLEAGPQVEGSQGHLSWFLQLLLPQVFLSHGGVTPVSASFLGVSCRKDPSPIRLGPAPVQSDLCLT